MKHTKPAFLRPLGRLNHVLLAMTLSFATFEAALANVNMASAPVFLKESVDPNLMFIYDDSGSMGWEYMPDSIKNELNIFWSSDGRFRNLSGNKRETNRPWYYSSKVNTVYYNPNTSYQPPYKPDGTGRMDNANFAAAWTNGYNKTGSVDLNTRFLTNRYYFGNGGFYFNFNPSTSCETNPKQQSCYSLVFLTDESADQQQNFANWYSYYRLRHFAARAGISEAFFDLPENIRVGYGTINSNYNNVDGALYTNTVISGVRPFTATRRQQFLDWLQGVNPSGSTPLRSALEDAGKYYSRTDNRGPWGNIPGTNDTNSHVECRPSYTILMTDGIWNGSNPSVGNADGSPGPAHSNPDPSGTNYAYNVKSPFGDTHSNTLADVAMHYWKTDLRTDLDNKVPTAGIDEAYWQHMTTFTIGLGVEGSINEADAFAAIDNENTTINWPQPSNSSAKIDDLLHAAVNGRGGFASAQSPEEFSQEIAGFLDTVIARAETSASAAAVSSAVLQTDSAGFFAGFRSADWSGTLVGYNFDQGLQIWDAEEQLRNTLPANRNIFTHNGTNAVELKTITDLSSTQIAALNADPDNAGESDNLGSNRINWLRGDTNAHSRFRDRSFTNESGETVQRLLGDIINANPLFVSNSNYGFSRLPGQEGTSYSTYRSQSTYQNRTKALYVAANDGMLHAFDTTTGQELFAYMPGELLSPRTGANHAEISQLISSNYTHRYYLDGTPVALDAHIDVNGSKQWRTVLVGTMGAGGRSVFALDVTDPTQTDENSVLWEFSHPDLGYGVSEAEIARLPNGDWAAIFGNGYNGDDQAASLFVVDLATGALIKQITTGVGGVGNSNGLATPVLTNLPDQGAITQYAYAGDLKGNIWRFDFAGKNNSNSWSATKLFTAKDPNGVVQPITTAPRLTINPSDLDELVLLFGTGSFIQSGDDTTDQVQSLYAIRDDLTQRNLTRGNLLAQTITEEKSVEVARADGSGNNIYTVRETSSNQLSNEHGWYLDLIYNGDKTGERVISRPNLPFGIFPDRVRFSTLIPDSDPCGSGRTGFIMDLKLLSGGAPEDPVFDLDSDGKFTNTDTISFSGSSGDKGAPSGINVGQGAEIRSIADGDREAFIIDPEQIDKDDPCDTALCGKALDNSIGRQTWEQLR
ncbi:pilus assembly protein [Marinobacter sp.]|uniref:pilus assembly protein n=1 Tax=Marinobacter sp. TaxID=50741 RepID=UPI002B266234|nr:PilC/PilY family type IV pilus protein [Marinobacter sp.]